VEQSKNRNSASKQQFEFPEQQLPTLTVEWDRFEDDPATNLKDALQRPTCWAVCGRIGKGKSSLVELIGSKYPKVIDLFGARDNESLSWCRSDRAGSILFLKGVGVQIDSSWPSENTLDVTIEQMQKYDAVVSCPSFYSTVKEEFYDIGMFMEKFYKRLHYDVKDVWCVVVREAANLLSSRLCIGETQTEAKAMMVYMLRQMRHHGVALALDSIRWKAVDIDIRDLAAYTFMKGQGIKGLPDDLKFLYNWFDPFGVMRMGKEKFILMSEDGPIGHGTATMPYWHKQEGEDLLRLFDIEVKYPDSLPQADSGQRHVNPYEHAKIVQVRYEKHLSYGKLGTEFSRSTKTIKDALDRHNRLIESMGQCTVCMTARCTLKDTYIPADIASTSEEEAEEAQTPKDA